MELSKTTLLSLLVVCFVVENVLGSCESILKTYDVASYNAPKCPSSSFHDGEIDNRCRFDIVDEKASTAAVTISTLMSHGYRLCFGCDNDIGGHCPDVIICAREAKCYNRSAGNGKRHFGCCDTTCGTCSGKCDGDFCNGDAFLQQQLPVIATTMPTTTAKSWSDWTSWSACISSDCHGTGVQVKTRQCLLTSGSCIGDATDSKLCAPPPCTSAAATTTQTSWTDWGSWSKCLAISCDGRGIRVRTRTCLTGTGKCTGSDSLTDSCLAPACTTTLHVPTTPTTLRTTQAAMTTPSASATSNLATASSGDCSDNNDAITNTCAYWVTYRVCEPGTASFQNIGSVYCKKTCGLCP